MLCADAPWTRAARLRGGIRREQDTTGARLRQPARLACPSAPVRSRRRRPGPRPLLPGRREGGVSRGASVGTIEGYYRLLDGNTAVDLAGLPEPERLRYEAAAAYARKDHQSVVATLRKLGGIDSAFAVAHPELLVCEAEALLDMGELASAATNLAGLFCKDRRLLPPVLLRRIAALLKDKRFAPSQHNVGWPILAAAAHNDDRQQIDLDRVHDFVGDYIEAQGVTRPGELLADRRNPPIELLVFLKECCTPDILESSIWFSSVEELLKERLSLCQELMDNFGDNDADLPREIADLTRQLAILDLTSQIQRSRIFIDTEAILRNIDELTVEHTTSLLTVRALLGNELKRGLKLLGLPSADTGRVRLLVVDESVALFEKVLERIKARFLYSPELGLDANLSQGIRHGALAGELRATFDRLHLSTKMQADDNYEPNTHWVNALHAWDPEDAEAINYAFRTFSAGLDAWVRKVREEWVQIRSNEKPGGRFDYAFTQDEIERWVTRISPLAEHADVYELVISALLERTERCLAEVRAVPGGGAGGDRRPPEGDARGPAGRPARSGGTCRGPTQPAGRQPPQHRDAMQDRSGASARQDPGVVLRGEPT